MSSSVYSQEPTQRSQSAPDKPGYWWFRKDDGTNISEAYGRIVCVLVTFGKQWMAHYPGEEVSDRVDSMNGRWTRADPPVWL